LYEDLGTFSKDDNKISELNTEFRKFVNAQAEALRILINQLAKAPAAFEGILIYAGKFSYPLTDDLVDLVLEDHLANPKMGQLCFDLRDRIQSGENWAERIIRKTAAKHPDLAVRGQAHYALGDMYHRYRAQPCHGKITEADEAKYLAQATEYYTEVVKNYAGFLSPDGGFKLGDKAAAELVRIKNLPNLKVGKSALDIVGKDMAGQPLRLSDYRGKVVMVVFWGTWCGPCMREVPHEQALLKKHEGKPFVILGVNSDKDLGAAVKISAEKQITWPSWFDGGSTDGPIQTAYNVRQWPTIYVLDPQGVIRYIDVRDEKLDEAVEELLAKESIKTAITEFGY